MIHLGLDTLLTLAIPLVLVILVAVAEAVEVAGSCFIATAAYGSAIEPQVELLCEFRDRFLITNSIGIKFVELYYHYSPPAANFIRDHEILRKLVGIVLLPLVGLSFVSLKIGFVTTAFVLLTLLSGAVFAIRRWTVEKNRLAMYASD